MLEGIIQKECKIEPNDKIKSNRDMLRKAAYSMKLEVNLYKLCIQYDYE